MILPSGEWFMQIRDRRDGLEQMPTLHAQTGSEAVFCFGVVGCVRDPGLTLDDPSRLPPRNW